MKESGQVSPEDVVALVDAEPTLWVRVAAVRQEDHWDATHVEMTSGVAPASWASRRWSYDEVVFLSCEISGSEGAAWLRSHEAEIDGVTVRLAGTPEGHTLQWHKRSSLQKYGFFDPLPWPSTLYDLASQSSASGPGFGSLIGDGPSFVSFAQAVVAYFGCALPPGGSVDHATPVFQLTDLRGRIAKVMLGSAEVEVHIEGNGLHGTVVELASVAMGPSEALSAESSQVVRFPLPHGLPNGAWVVLKERSEWIDRKFINYPNTLNADPGVEFVVEPMTELQALISGGEGPTVEFKSILPPSGSDLRNKVCAIVAAFANGDGGHILFGVTDGGAIVGLSGVDIQKECDTVAQFVSSTVTPVPHFRVARVSEEGNDGSALEVIVLTVDQGDQPPYGIDPAHPKYYVRRGATTFEASSDQVRALARSRPPADQAYQSPYGLRFL
jgi:hypothetical protein